MNVRWTTSGETVGFRFTSCLVRWQRGELNLSHFVYQWGSVLWITGELLFLDSQVFPDLCDVGHSGYDGCQPASGWTSSLASFLSPSPEFFDHILGWPSFFVGFFFCKARKGRQPSIHPDRIGPAHCSFIYCPSRGWLFSQKAERDKRFSCGLSVITYLPRSCWRKFVSKRETSRELVDFRLTVDLTALLGTWVYWWTAGVTGTWGTSLISSGGN